MCAVYVSALYECLSAGVWNSIFLCSNTSVFVLLPFAYFFTESEGLPGSKRVSIFSIKFHDFIAFRQLQNMPGVKMLTTTYSYGLYTPVCCVIPARTVLFSFVANHSLCEPSNWSILTNKNCLYNHK